jgi:signal transduction histidine kinase
MNSSPNSERARLARELHDGLALELASLGYRLDQVIGSSNLDNKDRAQAVSIAIENNLITKK